MLKLLVFDLDGTLADTRRDLAQSVNHALRQNGHAPLPLEKVMENVGNGAERLVANCLSAAVTAGSAPASADSAEVEKVLGDFLAHYRDHCLEHTGAYPGLTAALDRLRHRPDGLPRSMAVLTNKPQVPMTRILEGLGLAGYFALALGGDTEFGRKPEAGGLRHLMSALEASPAETVLIGDGLQDAGAARAAGTRLIGFLGGIASGEAMLRENPDAVFSRMDELPAAVASLETRAGRLSGRAA